jgi:hypothetical protein
MAHARLILLGVLAAIAVSAAAAATAFAHEFLVEGTAITELVDGAFESATSHIRGELSGVKVDVTAGSDSGTFSLSSGGVDAATISFTSNALYETNSAGEDIAPLSKCVVNESKPITFDVKTELLELSSVLLDTFTGATRPLIVNIPISGSSCALKKAVNELTGTFNAILPEHEVSKVLHSIEFNPSVTGTQSLDLAGKPATFTSTESLALCGSYAGKGWSSKK